MKFRAFASSSEGNVYIVSNEKSSLLIDAGVSINKLYKLLDFNLSNIDACLLSHAHLDHSCGAAGVMRSGVDVYCTQGTAEGAGLSGHRLHVIRPLEQFTVGPWRILPFPTVHDSNEPAGFLMASGRQKLLFAVDTGYLAYRFPGLTHLAIECNWSLPWLRDRVYSGDVPPMVAKQIRRRHFSLERLERMLRANDLSRLQEIHLLHMSDNNCDEAEAKKRIQRLTGLPVYVAQR